MTLPQAVPFVLFTLLPLGWVCYVSFTRYDGLGTPTWVGLDNYVTLASDTAWWSSVSTTFLFALLKMAIEVPLALLLAVLLNRGLRFAATFRTVFFLPHVLSIAVMGVVFYFLLRPDEGIVNGLLTATGVLDEPVDWLGDPWTALGSLVAVGVWSGFGLTTVLFLVGLQTIPREVLESARTDGANAWQVFTRITLPLLRPVLRIVMVLTIVFTLRTFDIVKTLTDGEPAGRTDVMFTYLFDYYFGSDRGAQFGYASALSVVAGAIIAAVSVLYLYASRTRDA